MIINNDPVKIKSWPDPVKVRLWPKPVLWLGGRMLKLPLRRPLTKDDNPIWVDNSFVVALDELRD